MKQLRASLNTDKGYVCGTLNVGISVNYALYRLPDVLYSFRQRYPHVDIHVMTEHSRKLYMQISEGAIDVAIMRGEFAWKGERIRLERDRICAIRSAQDAHKSLDDVPYIGRKTDGAFERELTQWMKENGLKDDGRGIQVDSITTCVEMVKRGLGWAIVPEICLGSFDGHIMPLTFADGEAFTRSTYLFCSEHHLALPQVAAFIDTVTNENK